MFLHLSVILFTDGVSGRRPPGRHTHGQTYPLARPPPPADDHFSAQYAADGHCSGQYTSYWNVFLSCLPRGGFLSKGGEGGGHSCSTRMHSSRMRTVCCSGCLPRGAVCHTHPPCEQNDRLLWKHYLVATTLRTVRTTRMHSSRMRTTRSSSHRGGGGELVLIPLNFPLGCWPGPDLPPWVWAWIWSPSISPLGVDLDLIPLNFPLGCVSGSDPPQFPPWVWAWRGGVWSQGWGVVSQHALRHPPPRWTESQTPVKTLPCPNFVAGGKDHKLLQGNHVGICSDSSLHRSYTESRLQRVRLLGAAG